MGDLEFSSMTVSIPGSAERAAVRAEAQGWDGLTFTDSQHLAGDPYGTLCLAARATETLGLATGVTPPGTRHPAVTASAIATVQVESDGRAVLGIGRGDSALALLGRRPVGVAAFEEYLVQVQAYLRGEEVEEHGHRAALRWLGEGPKVSVDVAVGPSEACAERLRTLAGLGLRRIVVNGGSRGADPGLMLEAGQRFAEEVIPRVRDGT
jgi:5,10-methylenetetrahydromethanopterin reductase